MYVYMYVCSVPLCYIALKIQLSTTYMYMSVYMYVHNIQHTCMGIVYLCSVSDVSLGVSGCGVPLMVRPTLVSVEESQRPPGEYYEEIIEENGVVEEYFAFDAR